jgi:glycosyltransferase involved in cell wall biosynthesis
MNTQQTAQKKKLLIASDSFLPRWDGVSRFLTEIIPLLANKYEVTIIAPNFSGEFKDIPGVTIIRFPTYKWKVADYHPAKVRMLTVRHLVKQSDIVWSQTLGPIGASAMVYAKRFKKPLVAYMHSIEWDLFSKSQKRFKKIIKTTSKLIVKRLYNKCSMLMVPSENIITFLEGEGITPKKEIVQLGTDILKFKPTDNKAAAKKKLGIDPKQTVIGYTGRFGREKDIPTLYEAFRKIAKERKDVTLLLVGGTLDKPFDDMENVKVFGQTDDIVPYLHAMDIYVLPSLTETTSLTTLEAMSSGLPVVVTPVGSIPTYIRHRHNGFIFPVKNIDRLSILIKNLVENPQLREKIGRAARRTVVNKYSWDDTAKKIIEILGRY